MKKFWQWLGFHVHDWGQWNEIEIMRRTLVGAVQIGEDRWVSIQVRRCRICGLRQERE